MLPVKSYKTFLLTTLFIGVVGTAFAGETCLGIASPQDGLFFLFIGAPVTGNPSSVTIKYYSAHYKNLFEAKDAFPFVNDDHLGTVANPLAPTFVVAE